MTTQNPTADASPGISEETRAKLSRAKLGNKNAVQRHGLYAGELGPGYAQVVRKTSEVRRQIEQAVLDAKGVIDLLDAAAINSAVRWERHAHLALKWLRDQMGSLQPTERLSFSREIARASSERDRCLRTLGLDPKAAGNPWAAIDAPAVEVAE